MEQSDTGMEIQQELNIETINRDLSTTEVNSDVVKDIESGAEIQCNEKDHHNSEQDLLEEVTTCSTDANSATCSSRKPIPFSRSRSYVSDIQSEPSQFYGISKASYTTPLETANFLPESHFMLPSIESRTLTNPSVFADKVCTTSSASPDLLSGAPRPHRIPSPTPMDSVVTIGTQPLDIFLNLPSPTSLVMNVVNQPQTLFMQALSKLYENPVSLAFINKTLRSAAMGNSNSTQSSGKAETAELSAPESLTSAPPSYSFVLRQMAARRPRLMGTFIPSPSFVQHTPPPNYAAAFDIYVEPALPPPNPTRVYSFGFTSMPAVCPECGYTGLTTVTAKITVCTHLCAMFLCLFCCWACAPLPYVLRSCKDVYHYCANCNNLLGIYCPTNPESTHLYAEYCIEL